MPALFRVLGRVGAALLALAICALTGAPAAESSSESAWRVTSILRAERSPCFRGAVRLRLVRQGVVVAEHRVTIGTPGDAVVDRSWDPRPGPGDYVLDVEVTACTGRRSVPALLPLRITGAERHRLVHVVLGLDVASPRLELLGVETEWAGAGLLEARRVGQDIVLTNTSEEPVRRCGSSGDGAVIEEYRAGESWGAFGHHVSYVWPKEAPVIEPGQSLGMRRGPVTLRAGGATAVTPSAARLRVRAETPSTHHVRLGSEPLPEGLTGCDVYSVDLPVPEGLRVWVESEGPSPVGGLRRGDERGDRR